MLTAGGPVGDGDFALRVQLAQDGEVLWGEGLAQLHEVDVLGEGAGERPGSRGSGLVEGLVQAKSGEGGGAAQVHGRASGGSEPQ